MSPYAEDAHERLREIDPNLIYPGSPDAPQAMPGEEMVMPKRPNVRKPDYDHEPIEKRLPESQTIPERKEEKMAADRLPEHERYPYNNFALTALVLAGLIILIGLAYVTGMVK